MQCTFFHSIFGNNCKVSFDPTCISWVVLKGGRFFHSKSIFAAERITNWHLLNSPLQTLESVVIRRKHIYYFATFFANSCSLLHFSHKTPFLPNKAPLSRQTFQNLFFRGKMEWVLEKAGQSKEPKGKSFWGNCVLLSGSPPPLGARVLAFPRKFCDYVVAHVRSKYTGICGVCTVVIFFQGAGTVTRQKSRLM